MKKLYLFLFTFSSLWLHAQVTIKGTVFDQKGNPLQGASVYLNNTTIGTSSDADGYFQLSIEHGYYDLIVSYVGFETSKYSLNTLEIPDEIVFQLFERSNELDEIVMKHKHSKSKRAYFLRKFRKNFLGQSFIAQKAKIKNEYAIKFEYDEANDILEATALEPLVIENKGLGYKLTYDLIHFELQPIGVTYMGYTFYEFMEGSAKKVRKWKEERELAYNGSLRHFLTAAMQKNDSAGFEVDDIKLIPNPEYPSEEDILEAEEFAQKHGGLQGNPYQSDPAIARKLRWANDILQKAQKLPKELEITLRKNILLRQYFTKEEDGMFLFPSESLMLRVRYKNEFQESNYSNPNKNLMSKKYQLTRINFYDERILVNSMGLFQNPLDAVLEGYMAFERVADLVPLDYKPPKTAEK